VTPKLSLGPHPYNPFALVASPKLGLRQASYFSLSKIQGIDNGGKYVNLWWDQM